MYIGEFVKWLELLSVVVVLVVVVVVVVVEVLLLGYFLEPPISKPKSWSLSLSFSADFDSKLLTEFIENAGGSL